MVNETGTVPHGTKSLAEEIDTERDPYKCSEYAHRMCGILGMLITGRVTLVGT